MTMPIRAKVLGVMLAAGAVPACGGDGSGPASGLLTVSLSTANTNDGAVMFTLTGAVDSVEAMPGYQAFTVAIDARTRRVIVIGDMGSGALARLHVRNAVAAAYQATVTQAAARGTFLQQPTVGYRLTIVP